MKVKFYVMEVDDIRISDTIRQLESFMYIFGDVDLKLAEYEKNETIKTYSKKLILNDCNMCVGNFGAEKLVAVIQKQIE